MVFFKNFIIAIILIGILTRIAKILYIKKVKKNIAIYLSFLTVGLISLPLISIFIGFDIAISEYLIALMIWLLFDLMRTSVNGKKSKK